VETDKAKGCHETWATGAVESAETECNLAAGTAGDIEANETKDCRARSIKGAVELAEVEGIRTAEATGPLESDGTESYRAAWATCAGEAEKLKPTVQRRPQGT